MSEPIAEVILDDALDKTLDYTIPIELLPRIKPGTRVEVPLGKTKRFATVLITKNKSFFPKLKPLHRTLDDKPLISQKRLELANWMSRYYLTPLRKTLRSFLPPAIRKNMQEKTQLFVTPCLSKNKLADLSQELKRKNPAQAKILDEILQNPKGLLLSELLEKAGTSKSPIDTLVKQNVLKCHKTAVDRSPLINATPFQAAPKKLNSEQQKALDAITNPTFHTYLLHGITGSGKTEVYFQAMQKALDAGKSVIMLIPEIALTAQTVERLKTRFKEKIAILHHRLSAGEKRDMWMAIHRGEISIVVGPRSALFAPLTNLGIIIIDEEHDSSFKQEDEMPTYHARDVAIVRAKLEDCPIVLGSATPTLESYTNALNGKYTLLTLKKRATGAKQPTVSYINLKAEKNRGLFSDTLLTAIKNRAEKGEQILLFLNKRGYNTHLFCEECGTATLCPHCDFALTFHKAKNKLLCHICGHSTDLKRTCEKNHPLKFKGFGTEMVERTLNAILPDIRTLRMDGDTTRHKGSHERHYKSFRSGKADVLIGTQMIAKGFHFPAVTLVAILGIDSTLNFPDFRSQENAFALITQVAGRAGRAELGGHVLIQTYDPNNPTLKLAADADYENFYNQEIASRKKYDFPPFARLTKLTFTSKDQNLATSAAEQTYQTLKKKLPNHTLYPPQPAYPAKIKDRHRVSLLIKGKRPPPLPYIPLPKNCRCHIEVDPHTSL